MSQDKVLSVPLVGLDVTAGQSVTVSSQEPQLRCPSSVWSLRNCYTVSSGEDLGAMDTGSVDWTAWRVYPCPCPAPAWPHLPFSLSAPRWGLGPELLLRLYFIFLGSLLQQHYLLHYFLLMGPEGRTGCRHCMSVGHEWGRGSALSLHILGTVFPPNSIEALPILRDGYQPSSRKVSLCHTLSQDTTRKGLPLLLSNAPNKWKMQG